MLPSYLIVSWKGLPLEKAVSKLGVSVGMLNSWIMPLSGREWMGKVRKKWKTGRKKSCMRNQEAFQLSFALTVVKCQIDLNYDNTVCIRQHTALLLCSVKYIRNGGWSVTLGLLYNGKLKLLSKMLISFIIWPLLSKLSMCLPFPRTHFVFWNHHMCHVLQMAKRDWLEMDMSWYVSTFWKWKYWWLVG